MLPDWQVSRWFSTEGPLHLSDLRGRVVLIHVFPMLCPGCVAHGLLLAARVHQRFGGEGVAVVGLHCVFEHHEAMGPQALQAFIHDYRLRFASFRRPRRAAPGRGNRAAAGAADR
jgi:peroxiredoxin